MSKRVATTDFIQRAREVHGSRYDYSKVSYVSAKSKVIIICRQHGEFEQTPANHCTGHGCRDCGRNKPLTFDRFVQRAHNKHRGRYDYSRVAFKNVETKIVIICPDHGPFRQRLMTHLKGFGCPRCGWDITAKKLRHNFNRFLEDARKAHHDRYDYSLVEYVNALSKVKIICLHHGIYEQKPANHIRGVGCPKCGDESTADQRRRSTQEFVSEAMEVHGDKYDYSRVEYRSSHEKVEIICEEHGAFLQSPANHVRGNKAGCPGCAVSGFDQTKPGLLYYIAVSADDGKTRYKIGITNLSVAKRFPTIDLARIRVVKTWLFELGYEAADREAEILHQYAANRYFGPDLLVGAGKTELFTHDVLRLDAEEHGHLVSAVNEEAKLIARPTQYEFAFEPLTENFKTFNTDNPTTAASQQ